jgi:hypothetical protein
MSAMTRSRRIILWVYLSGGVICEILALWGAYDSGGFERDHTLRDLAMIGGIHLTAALLWPIVLVVGLLQYFGILRHPITF